MKKEKKIFFIFLSITFLFLYLHSENETNYENTSQKFYHRDYSVIYSIKYDVKNSSENFRTLFKILSDSYYRGLANYIENDFLESVGGFCTSFLIKWSTIL